MTDSNSQALYRALPQAPNDGQILVRYSVSHSSAEEAEASQSSVTSVCNQATHTECCMLACALMFFALAEVWHRTSSSVRQLQTSSKTHSALCTSVPFSGDTAESCGTCHPPVQCLQSSDTALLLAVAHIAGCMRAPSAHLTGVSVPVRQRPLLLKQGQVNPKPKAERGCTNPHPHPAARCV